MRLQRLTQLERNKLIEEYREVLKQIEYLKSILASEGLVRTIIKDELLEIRTPLSTSEEHRSSKRKPS